MYTRRFEKFYPGLRKEEIWELWTDINNWSSWHDKLDYCRLEGPFEVGQGFTLKPAGAKPVSIELIDIQPYRSFSDRTRFPGAQMIDTHSLEEREGGLLLSNQITVKGPLSWLWTWLVVRHVAASIPSKTEALVSLARQRHAR